MITILSTLIAFTAISSPASAQDQADFAAANEKSLAGDMQGAIALYEDLLARGVRNEDVLFNLGNNYAQSGRLVDAVVAYERALRLVPFDRDVAQNLARVRARLHAGDEPARVEQPVEAVEAIVAHVPVMIARLGFVLGLSLFFLGWYGLRRSSLRWLRRGFAALMTFGMLTGAPLGVVAAGQEWVRLEERVVLLEEGVLKEGPDPRFPDAGRVRAGSRGRKLGEDGAWLRVQTDEGSTGWVENTRVHSVDR